MGKVTRGHGAETRTRGPEGKRAEERDRAKVQIGAELLCKGERGEAARGHVGKLTR